MLHCTLLTLLRTMLASECTLLPDGLVLNKYILKNCGACQRIEPVLNEIRHKIDQTELPVKYREIVCNDCECEGITHFPTIEVTKDKQSAGKTIGYKDYNELSKWVAESLKVDPKVFKQSIDTESGKVTQLKSKDFLGGFSGQWLVLFYDNYNDETRKIIRELAKKFEGRVNIGEVHSAEVTHVSSRFNIQSFPHITAINHGTIVPYSEDLFTENNLDNFTERLYRPNFQNITFNELKKVTELHSNGEPSYVVLYKNYDLASHYFNDLAQQFKFKATIYRSNDPVMFEKAGFMPKEESISGDHEEMVHLMVYKHGAFYPCPFKLEQNDEIIQWIFHSHFPYVTNISNENFYSVFHGIKPVILLLTHSEGYVSQFNQISADRHLGTPYTNIIFATLDIDRYPSFKKQVLDKVKAPGIAIFDPFTSKWFYREAALTHENIKSMTIETINSFFSKSLPPYPPKPSKRNAYAVCILVVGVILYIVSANASHRKLE